MDRPCSCEGGRQGRRTQARFRSRRSLPQVYPSIRLTCTRVCPSIRLICLRSVHLFDSFVFLFDSVLRADLAVAEVGVRADARGGVPTVVEVAVGHVAP